MPNGRKDIAAIVMEFIGTFALMFLGAGSIILTKGENLVAIALAHGLAIGVMIAAGGHLSGGLFNPAVAIGLMSTGKLPPLRGLAFIVSEMLGGIAAAIVLKAMLPAALVNDPKVKLGATLPGPGIEAWQACGIEIVLTFFLMFVIYGAAVDKRGATAIAPLAIGLTITIDILMGGGFTGASMNPARSIGPMLLQSEWTAAWVYFVGPIVGAVLAALVYHFVLYDDQPVPTEVAKVEPHPERPTRSNPPAGRAAARRR